MSFCFGGFFGSEERDARGMLIQDMISKRQNSSLAVFPRAAFITLSRLQIKASWPGNIDQFHPWPVEAGK
jgi:hypothetical protein